VQSVVQFLLSFLCVLCALCGGGVFSFGAEGGPIRILFVLNFVFRSFEFVSDLEFRISDLPSYSLTHLRILSVFSVPALSQVEGPSVAEEFLSAEGGIEYPVSGHPVPTSLLIRTTQLTLWTKAKLCGKACFESIPRREHQAGRNFSFVLCVLCGEQNLCLSAVGGLISEICGSISVSVHSLSNN
jgi:hypothetical protein